MERKTLAEGISLTTLGDGRYVCNRISVNLCFPRSEEASAQGAMLSYLLRRGSERYPGFAPLNRKLYDLYGAYYDCTLATLGGCQVLSLAVQTIDEAFAWKREKINGELADFLCDMLLRPNAPGGAFLPDEVAVEQKNLCEEIDSEINNKRAYALGRSREILYAGTPLAGSRLGTKEAVLALDGAALYRALQRLLESAQVEILCSGRGDFSGAAEVFARQLGGLPPRPAVFSLPPLPSTEGPREVEEALSVTQSKLALSFLPARRFAPEQYGAVRAAVALFGGAPFSRLFANVREKQSLCYYCDARFNRVTGVLTVDCGLDEKDVPRAEESIRRELAELAAGNFTDEELQDAKAYLKNSMTAMEDSLAELDPWYLGQVLEGDAQSPQDAAAQIEAATREEVMAVCASFSQRLRYLLKPRQRAL